MGRFVAICQNEAGEQYWWFEDRPEGKCATPGCNCRPKFYVPYDRPKGRSKRANQTARARG